MEILITAGLGLFLGATLIHFFNRKKISDLTNENLEIKKDLNITKEKLNEAEAENLVKDKEIELINKNSSEKLEFKNQMIEAVGKSVSETTQKEQKPYLIELAKEVLN